VTERRQKVGKRAFPLTARERFPFASTVGADLGKRRVAQRFPVFSDTEEVTGSNPVAPTNKTLTSGNAAGPFPSHGRRAKRAFNRLGRGLRTWIPSVVAGGLTSTFAD